jgi:hypothetical protein
MDYFKHQTYERSQVQFSNAYASNIVAYLRRRHPTISTDEILSFVKKEIQTNLKKPKMLTVTYPSYGNAKVEPIDLFSYTGTIRENIITPAGVLYMRPSKKESFLKIKITGNLKFRKTQKKRMLEAAAIGDLITEQVANYLQASIKIETNSIPGAFGSPFNCLFDIPGYNAVTSVGRHAIMCGYAHVEKLVAGNFYFPTLDHVINYCINLCRLCPPNIMQVVDRHGLYIPSVQDVCEHFTVSMRHYMYMTDQIKLRLHGLIASLPVSERIFVYYAYCLKTLLVKNEKFFRAFLADFFRTDVRPSADAPKGIYSFNADLTAMVTALNSDMINRQPVSDAIATCPDGVQKLMGIGKHMEGKLSDISDILQTFLRIDCDTADAMSHPNMIRKAVIISDTDSVLFSTQNWIEWYTGKISFEREAYEVNAFVVFLVVMTLEQVFARLSTNFGAEGEDIYKISMKNEFMYPLMLRTPLPKQYAGRVAIQEGFVLPKTKNDIKGLSFRSSTMCSETTKAGTDFVNWIFDEVTKHGSISAGECIQRALAHEIRVIESIQTGDRTFLTTKPIRPKTEYKDAAASIYYYWTLWDQVFKPNFGEFVIPAKGYELPIIGGGKSLKSEAWLQRLQAFDKKLHDRLVAFMENNAREITAIYIPMTLKDIPEILRPVIDTRKIVYNNSTPFIVTLRSLGIGYTESNNQTLLSDIYTL